jgi:histidinol-phosphate aminotransferase
MITTAADDMIARWVPPRIRALSAYKVQSAAGLIKLDAMENPYAWPAEIVEGWLEALRSVELNRYPAASADELKGALAAHLNVPSGASLVLGNGSDELIGLLAMLLTGSGRTMVCPEPSFSMYRQVCAMVDMHYVPVPLATNFELDRSAMLAAIAEHEPALIFIAYPNNPTGNLFDEADVRAVIEASPGLVVVDEAYGPFSDASFMDAVGSYPNLAVMRTLSKAGFAGLRLGLMALPPAWADEVEKLRLPYNINTLTQASALYALSHYRAFDQQVASIRAERAALVRHLGARPGVHLHRSAANFVLLRLPIGSGTAVFQRIREEGVLVKNLHGAGPGLDDCLRVTVGSPAENARFLEALDIALSAHC